MIYLSLGVVRKSHVFPIDEKKKIFLGSHQSTTSVFSCRPYTKIVFEMSIQNASETSFPDWKKETCYCQCYREKNICWKTLTNALALVWEGDNAKVLCNVMQVHRWAKHITGLGDISKVNLNQAQLSPVAPNICFSPLDWGGFCYRCNRLPYTLCWYWQNLFWEWDILRSVRYNKVAQYILVLAY